MGKIPYDQETKDNTIDWWLPFYNTTLQLPATTEKNNKCAILVTILSSCLVTQRLNKLTPYEYCSFLRRPSSKRRYPCLNFWLKSRWEAWTGVELSKMTRAFFSVCRWEKNHEKQVQNLQFRSERSLSLTFRDRVKTNQGEIFFINKTGQNIFIFLKWSHLRMVVRF